MSLRSLFFVPLVASGFLAAPLAADRLLVAGSDGNVMQTDMSEDLLEYFTCTCNGPIRALASDGQRLYVADEFDQIVVFDVDDGALQSFLFPSIGQINAIAARWGALYAGTEDGLVVRVDRITGATLEQRALTTGVRALLVHGRFLFAAGADGAVYRAPLAGGGFEYFTCFCFTNIQDMVVVGGDLFIVDAWGLVGRADGQTGTLVNAFSVGPTNSMAASRGKLLFYYEGSGTISMFDAATGAALPDGFTSPTDVQTMLVIPDGMESRTRRARPPGSL